jgi:hypothetical protein
VRTHRETSISVSPELRRLLVHCEQKCTADCCKSDAFNIDAVTIRRWLDEERIDRSSNMRSELADLVEHIGTATNRIRFDIRGLESVWEQHDALLFFKKCFDCFPAAVNENSA